MLRTLIGSFRRRAARSFASIFAAALTLPIIAGVASAQTADVIPIQHFTAVADGQLVTSSLPLYKLKVQDGLLVTESTFQNGVWTPAQVPVPFNSPAPQSLVTAKAAGCVINFSSPPNWAAFHTTFYVAVADGGAYALYALNACGKAPLNFNGQQYANQSKTNFVNHAQMAANATGQALGSTVSVVAAGEIDIVDGKVIYMDNCSGHFRPTVGGTLAYMYTLTELLGTPAPLTLAQPLLDAFAAGSISESEIAAGFIAQQDGTTPSRRIDAATGNEVGVRAGTSNCNGYTTVFLPTNKTGTSVDLVGGLMIYNGGPINVYRSTVGGESWSNLKTMYLQRNYGIYYYQAYVVTDLHFWNNALNLYFTDETNDTYSLSIHVFSYNHDVAYNSDHPNIRKITISQYY